MRRVPLWLIALLTFSGTLAMHVFVPALPAAAAGLGAGSTALQLTITLYIIGLAVGQLIYGPLSDRFGRRVTLMAGLVLYIVASIACLLAPSVETLIVARLFQALGGCAGLVLGRAIVRDTAGAGDTARQIALVNQMVTLGPALAPLIGGAVVDIAGWRAIFVLISALGAINLALAWRLLPETATHRSGDGAAVLRSYGRLLVTPSFLGFAIGGGCATTSIYAFLVAAPFVFVHELHQPISAVGVYLAILVLGIATGSVLASRLLGRVPTRRLMVAGNLVSMVAALALLAAVLFGTLSVKLVIGLMFVFTIGAGLTAPASLTEAISVDPQVIGSASGLYGFTQMALGAAFTVLAGVGHNPTLAAAAVMVAACVIAQLAFWVALRMRKRNQA